MQDPLYKKIEVKCIKCKTKFQIWIENSHFSSEVEKKIRENFYKHCPVCKALEEIDKETSI